MKRARFIPLGDVVFVEKTTHGILLGVGEERFRAARVLARRRREEKRLKYANSVIVSVAGCK